MSARTKARKRAVDAVFASDIRKENPAELLQATQKQMEDRQNQNEIFGYAEEIVAGVVEHYEEIDDLIETYSQDWSIDRMPTLDRAILRCALWEILFNPEVPNGVAINEAVEIAKEFSTDDSGGFINGLLSKIASTRQAK
ncbi:MAG: transcription antitermination factor NusB [Actinomycetales bacterium]|nr:transcription antitermination factor NusB [Actinomycetales bacterium]